MTRPIPSERPDWIGFVDLLIQSQKVRLGSANADSIQFPTEEAWAGFREAAAYHGLLLGTMAAFSQADVLSRMPQALRSSLEEECQRHSTFQLSQAVELGRLAERLDRSGIAALAFKGPVLTQQLFGDVVSRESTDMDLLVPGGSVFEALDVLEKEGYEWAETGPRPNKAADLLSNHAFTLQSSDRRFLVDLHWHVAEDVALDFVPELSSLFEDPETVELLGRPVLTVSSEKQLSLLSFHAVKHAWYLLKWFVDIAALVKVPEFDWDTALRFIDASKAGGVARVSHVGLLVADRLFDCPLPPEVRHRIERDRRAVALVPVVIDDIRMSREYDMSEQHRVLVALDEGGWSRLKRAGAGVWARVSRAGV